MRKHILIIKHGSLGDVVRTSYFAGAVRERIYGLKVCGFNQELVTKVVGLF